MVENVLCHAMDILFIPDKDDESNKINFFVPLYNVSRFKQHTRRIKANVTFHVWVCAPNSKAVQNIVCVVQSALDQQARQE